MSINNFEQLLDDINSIIPDSNVPTWASILINCFKGLIEHFKCVNIVVNKVEELQSINLIQKAVTDNLTAENDRLNNEILKLTVRIDDQEQRGRNNCLLLHGVQENENEDTDDLVIDIINSKLGITISRDEIQRSHRLGVKKSKRYTRSTKSNNRPIIFRFLSYRKRNEVFKAKKVLKGEVSLSENLTKMRMELYKAAMDKYGKGKVWTTEGRILTKIDDQYVTINSLKDL